MELSSKRRKKHAIALFMSKSPKPNLQLLPELVLLKIFSYLPYFPDVSDGIPRVCKRFRDLALNPSLPTNLYINSNLLERESVNRILKVIIRSTGLRHLKFDFNLSTYLRKSDLEGFFKILQVISEKRRCLRSLRIGTNEVSGDYTPTLEFHQILCSSLIKISKNSELEVIELGIPVCADIVFETIDNIKHSLHSFIIRNRETIIGNKIFDKLCCCSRLEELTIHLNNKEGAASYDGIPTFGNIIDLKKFLLTSQEMFYCNLGSVSASFFKNLESIRLINITVHQTDIENILEHSQKLKEIEMTLVGCSVDNVLRKISNPLYIEKLIIFNGIFITERGLNIIPNLTSLKEICINSIDNSLNLSPLDIINVFKIAKLHNLVRCELDFALLDDACVKIITEKCPKLEVVGFNHSERITDLNITSLVTNSRYIRKVCFEKCPNISDHGVKYLISNCKMIEILNIKHTSVSKLYCDKELFLEGTEVFCSHKGCVNYKSDIISEYLDEDEYEHDSYSFKDYRYRR